MALQRDTLYAGRFSTATSSHPQGAFKNRTTSTAQDGSYLEAQWLNDWDGFFGSLLSKAGLTPDGNVDAVGASQYFNALLTVASVAPVGTSRNLKCSVTTASTTATFTADELVLGTALNGQKYHISSLSASVSLTTTGAGGMDTGSAPVSGYVAIYAILNPTTGSSGLLGVNATSAVVPEVYGGSHLPSGYTASALIAVWPTNSGGQFIIGRWLNRSFRRDQINVLASSSQLLSYTALSVSSVVPINAKIIDVHISPYQTTSANGCQIYVAGDSLGMDLVTSTAAVSGVTNSQSVATKLISITTPQTLYYKLQAVGTYSYQVNINGYDI